MSSFKDKHMMSFISLKQGDMSQVMGGTPSQQ
jgi:hypothetical protein